MQPQSFSSDHSSLGGSVDGDGNRSVEATVVAVVTVVPTLLLLSAGSLLHASSAPISPLPWKRYKTLYQCFQASPAPVLRSGLEAAQAPSFVRLVLYAGTCLECCSSAIVVVTVVEIESAVLIAVSTVRSTLHM